MATIAAGSFFVRLVQPVGTSWYNMQLCFFPEYVVLFVVGLWAGRRGFLRALPRQAGMMWLKLAFIIGVPSWFLLLGLGGALTGSEQAFVGGMHWQAAGYAAWEAFFAVSVSIGLLTLYREKANVRNRGTGLLADTCFGIYVFHAPILVAVSMVLRTYTVYPLAKAAIAAAVAFALSLGFAWVVRKVPGLRRVFA
jgi:surface polysaccharide O-acyltransferase-like enzyme